MTYPTHEDAYQADPIHLAALRKEMGERLGASLDQKPVGMPQHLTLLMERLRDEQPDPGS
jgi:hypothetical protein